MLTIFSRTKKVTLDCFTDNNAAYQLTPIIKGTKTYPEWFTNLTPLINHVDSNMRLCYGFTELFKRSAVLEAWGDVDVRIDPTNNIWRISNGEKITQHDRSQFLGAFENFHHMKLNSPWLFREQRGIHFAWVGAEWHIDKLPIKVLPGCIEYKVNHATHVNIMTPVAFEPYSYAIRMGTPLVHIVPLTEDDFEIKNHLITSEEMRKISMGNKTFFGFQTQIKLDKRNTKRKGKCPFGFGS